jgi:hypothetical protein
MCRAFVTLLLLLALGVSLVRLLMGGLRMLLRTLGMLFALRMIALAMMFGGRTMRLGGVFVMFGCPVVFVSCHLRAPCVVCQLPVAIKPPIPELFRIRVQLR